MGNLSDLHLQMHLPVLQTPKRAEPGQWHGTSSTPLSEGGVQDRSHQTGRPGVGNGGTTFTAHRYNLDNLPSKPTLKFSIVLYPTHVHVHSSSTRPSQPQLTLRLSYLHTSPFLSPPSSSITYLITPDQARLKRSNLVLRRHLREDIKRARADRPELAHHQPTRRRGQAVPVAVEDGILEEPDCGFCCRKASALQHVKPRGKKLTVAHLGKGAHVARQAYPVEGREAAISVAKVSQHDHRKLGTVKPPTWSCNRQ